MATPVERREEAHGEPPGSKISSLTEAVLDVLLLLGFSRPMSLDFI
jgi:hypothetical protein